MSSHLHPRIQYEADYESGPRSLRAEVPMLGHDSMAVFRRVDAGQLEQGLLAARLSLGSLLDSARGEYDHESSVSLLEQSEPLKQKPISKVAVADAINAVYQEVPSLRRGQVARPTGIALMSRKVHHQKSLAVTFDPQDVDFFLDERGQIIQTLESLAQEPILHEFDWLRQKTPHISLGKIALGRAHEVTQEHIQPILDALPSQVRIGKAVLYSSGVSKRFQRAGSLRNKIFRPINSYAA